MKILYLGVYKDSSGYGRAAQEYIMAMNSVGLNIVPRAIKLDNSNPEIYPEILELEKKSDKNCDIVIQHILPSMMEYNGCFARNIGMYASETSHFRNSNWAEKLNLMDEAWVFNSQQVECAKNSGVEIPISVVPHPCNPSKYSKYYKKINFPELKGKFVFYFIGEVTRRKNLVAALEAFHLEFDPNEPVAFVIKGNMAGMSDMECNKYIVNICTEVKKNLKLYPDISNYHGELIITQRLTEDEMMRLHSTCNCMVSPSYGEAWGLPTFDSMALGKTPICADNTGPHDFLMVKPEICGGWLVQCYEEPVKGMIGSNIIGELYHGNENWWKVDVLELAKIMRYVYEHPEEKRKRAAIGIDRAYDYSYEKIGNQIKELLCD